MLARGGVTQPALRRMRLGVMSGGGSSLPRLGTNSAVCGRNASIPRMPANRIHLASTAKQAGGLGAIMHATARSCKVPQQIIFPIFANRGYATSTHDDINQRQRTARFHVRAPRCLHPLLPLRRPLAHCDHLRGAHGQTFEARMMAEEGKWQQAIEEYSKAIDAVASDPAPFIERAGA